MSKFNINDHLINKNTKITKRTKKSKTSDYQGFNYKNYVTNETQLFRTRTNANNLKSALLMAENPQQRNRFELLRVYQNVDLDGGVKGLQKQRLLPLLSCEMKFYDDKGNEIDSKLDEQVWFRKFIEYSFQSLFWGFSFIQLGDITEGKITDVTLIPRQYCRPDFDAVTPSQQGLAEAIYFTENQELRDWVIPVYRDKNDLGDYSFLSIYIMMKQFSEINFAEFTEKYGSPIALAKTDLQNVETRDMLISMLQNHGNQAWAVVNDTDELELHETKNKGEVYTDFLNYINEQLSIAILGQTLTSQSQVGGTKELGHIHKSILDSIIESDIYFIQSQINDKLLPLLKLHNLLPENTSSFKMKRHEDVDVAKLLSEVKMLKEMGIEVDKDWLRQKINIPIL